MPIVKTVKGNLLNMFKEDEFDFIVHGCNCFHTMGAGIAGQIAKEFPQAYASDKRTSVYGDRSKLGKYSYTTTRYGVIINGYTQFYPGREDKNTLYRSIGSVFCRLSDTVDTFYKRNKEFSVGIPKIGAGIAGGDWSVIEKIIDGLSERLSVIVVDYDGS